MNFELNDDETLLMDALTTLTERHGQTPGNHTGSWYYGEAMASELAAGGYLNIAREQGYSALHAALMVEQVASQAAVCEIAATALIAPQISRQIIDGPIALIDARDGDINRPTRFLVQARSALVLLANDVAVLPLQPSDVSPIDSFLAYPIGRLKSSSLAQAHTLGAAAVPLLQQWWQLSLALEIAGCMRGALDKTLAYVKDRKAFNRPIGAFQAVQHRLAYCAQMSHATRWLALRAADSGLPEDAAVAACYAQDMAETLYYDLHQFTGAIGLTFEYPLHYWTLRMKVLQAELGGGIAQADCAAMALWQNH